LAVDLLRGVNIYLVGMMGAGKTTVEDDDRPSGGSINLKK